MKTTETREKMRNDKPLAVVVAVLAIAGVYWFAKGRVSSDAELPPELPHAVILIEGLDIRSDDRNQVKDITDKLLYHAGVSVSSITRRFSPAWGDPAGGPSKGGAAQDEIGKILIPPKQKGYPPTVKAFQDATPEEIDAALPYFRCGDWIVPRLLSPDLKTAIIRIAPGDPRHVRGFPPGTREKVLQFASEHLPKFKHIVYSKSLGIGGAAERDAINAVFGVQSIVLRLESATKGLRSLQGLGPLAAVRREALDTGPKGEKLVRSFTTVLNFGDYFASVMMLNPGDAPAAAGGLGVALELAKREKMSCYVNDDGSVAVAEIATAAEDENYEILSFRLAAPFTQAAGQTVRFYKRK